jgi:uncharacterized membrane protein YkoI
MMKNIIRATATIIASAMIILSASPVTAFAKNMDTKEASIKTSVAATKTTQSITKDQALEIVLKHAGYDKKDILFSKVKEDFDDNIDVYEVEFRVGFCEYNYDIEIATGEIVEFEIDD